MFSSVRVCAAVAVAAAAAAVLYSLCSFPHRGRCLPSLLLVLFTWKSVGAAAAVPARSRPLALIPRQKRTRVPIQPFAFVLLLPLLLPLLFTACVRFPNSVYRRCCCCCCCSCCCCCCCCRRCCVPARENTTWWRSPSLLLLLLLLLPLHLLLL